MPPELSPTPRAGFWRRVGAFSLDMLACGLVIAVLGTAVFAMSGGRVQTAPFAITVNSCTGKESIPPDLSPAPPEGSNFVSDCIWGTVPGLPMMRSLVVGRQTMSQDTQIRRWVSYPLSADGSRVSPFDASWIGRLGALIVLAAFLCRTGMTPGMRLLHIHMVDLRDPERRGVPLLKLVVRVAILVAGFVPAIAIGIAGIVWSKSDPEHVPAFTLALLMLFAAAIWAVWNARLIGRKRDPVYDRVSGLAVVRAHRGVGSRQGDATSIRD